MPRTRPQPPGRPLRTRVPSERVLAACARFGLAVPPPPQPGATPRYCRWAPRFATLVDRCLSPGQIALIVGPSGAGKSVLLQALQHRLRARVLRVPSRPSPRESALALADLDSSPLDDWLRHLARAGLAEAALLPQPVCTLSDGQAWRALLALTLARAARRQTPTTILVDEFTAALDRTTAVGVSRTLSRLVHASPGRSPGPRLIVSTTHDDILESLRPNLVLHVPLAAPPEVLMP